MKKKILSIILGLSMLMSMSATAFATESTAAGELESIVPYDNMAYVVNLTAGSPTQIYINSDYVHEDYVLSVRNLIYSPGDVRLTVVEQTGNQITPPMDYNPGTALSATIPEGTDGYSVFANASVSGTYYFTISGDGVDNPNEDTYYHFLKIQQANVHTGVRTVSMPATSTGITVTNTIHSPGTLTVRLINYAGVVIGPAQTLTPGQSYTFPATVLNGLVTVQAQASTLGTYVVTTEVQGLLVE